MVAHAHPLVPAEVKRNVPLTAAAPLEAWLDWLEHGNGRGIELGLERCHKVADKLGLGRPAPVVVTVAGTNGKGSSVAMLEAIWRAAGYRVGAYTSPHLLRFNERIRISGAAVADERICAAFAAVEARREAVRLTYFEYATLAALQIFAASDLDVVILEVGLGGRLDAVNIVDADLALITAIDLDHEQWLGSTREQIAVEKAGIMRHGRPAVCSDRAIPASLLDIAREKGAECFVLGADFAFQIDASDWTWWSGDQVLEKLPLPALDGMHQMRNAAGVLKAVVALETRLPVVHDAIRAGLEGVGLSARFQRIPGAVEHIVDVAHNPQAARVFADMLPPPGPDSRTFAVVGMLKTKNHREFLRPLLDRVDTWLFADLGAANAAPAQVLAEQLRQLDRRASATCHASPGEAHTAALAGARPGDRILVLGSFLTAAGIIKRLQADGI